MKFKQILHYEENQFIGLLDDGTAVTLALKRPAQSPPVLQVGELKIYDMRPTEPSVVDAFANSEK